MPLQKSERQIRTEKDLLEENDPGKIYQYARDILYGRFHEGEAAIANEEAELAYEYAVNIIKGRFLEAEAVIAEDPEYACYYAKDIIKGRFPEGEAAIAKYADISLYYAKEVIKDRFPEGEEAILNEPEYRDDYLKFLSEQNIQELFKINDEDFLALKLKYVDNELLLHLLSTYKS